MGWTNEHRTAGWMPTMMGFVAGACVCTLASATDSIRKETEAFLQAETIAVRADSAISMNLRSSKWNSAPETLVRLHPQRSVRLNDATANASSDSAVPVDLSVRTLVAGERIGFLLEWKDSTESRVDPTETHLFADSVAIQFPETFGNGVRLPHIGMGDEGSQVRVYMQRASRRSGTWGEYLGKGFGSLTRLSNSSMKGVMEYDAQAKSWRALFVRPLKVGRHSLRAGMVPVAFAIWDGAGSQRGGNKQLSKWKYLRIPGQKTDPKYLLQVSYGFHPGDLGSSERGRAKAATLCTSCHWMGGVRTAPAGMAPDLENIGAIATLDYIRDSIVNPNQVVVRNLHLNRHYDKSSPPDANRAYPNNAMYQWYIDLGPGNRMSRMPAFNLSPEDLADVVAFLKDQDGSAHEGEKR